MLLILYGATAEMGFLSRKYLTESGYELIEKYNYAPNKPEISTFYGVRNYVDKDTFYENTDSLFRYEMGGIHMGFNQQQISDAVCNKSNALLTLSAPNIGFLSEIKRIYAENVCLIYAYLDDATLKKIIGNLPDISEEEAVKRFDIGTDVKKNYAMNPSLFDKVVIYGGEDSIFDNENLIKQYCSIIESLSSKSIVEKKHADIFISYAHKDRELCQLIRTALLDKGISVFTAPDDIKPGEEYAKRIFDEIQHAKVFVPIITDNSIGSEWVRAEIQSALDTAENNGTLIVPYFLRNVKFVEDNPLYHRLAFISGVVTEESELGASATILAERIEKIFSAEANLKGLSKSVDNYLCLKMYNQAALHQKAHMDLCDDVYAMSNGAYIDIDACLLSRIKLASIYLDMDQPNEALEYVIDALNFEEEESQTFDTLSEQFAICCIRCKMSEDYVRELIKERLTGAKFFEGKFYIPQGEQYLNDLMECYISAKETSNYGEIDDADNSADVDESQIAQYGELVMDLFDTLLKSEDGSVSSYDLIVGYERVLNYCKHIGLKGEIADKCITRIAELKASGDTSENNNGSAYTEALKIYLGQALPMSGEYDVFLSYKSEDEVLAKKVYDYLVQTGKEVFFAKETLPQLGESEYEEMIFDAIDKSKHMILIGSNPEYLKTSWVKDEWSTFNNEIREGRKKGNLILLLSDDIAANKGSLPGQLRQKEIVKMSEFRTRLLSYLR